METEHMMASKKPETIPSLPLRLSETELLLSGLNLLGLSDSVVHRDLVKKLTAIQEAWKKVEEARAQIKQVVKSKAFTKKK